MVESFLFKKFKQNALKNLTMIPPVMPPMMPVLPNRTALRSISNNPVLNKTEEIDNFLDDLIENKKDN